MSSKSKTKGPVPQIKKPIVTNGTVIKPKIPAPTPAVPPAPPAEASTTPPAELEDGAPGELGELDDGTAAELEEGKTKAADKSRMDYHERKRGFQAELADLLEKWGFTREAFRTRNPRRPPRKG